MKEYVGIYIKTEKAQEQDGFGNKMKYHFHITTYISIHNLSKGKTQKNDTYVRLLCGSGISFCCQSHLVHLISVMLVLV